MSHDAFRIAGATAAVAFLTSLSGAAAAQTAFREPFQYSPAGADLLGQAGGTGFDGPWFPSGFNAFIHDNYDLGEGSLSSPPLVATGQRMETAFTDAIAGLGRNLAVPVLADATATAYFSLLIRPEGVLGEGAFNGFCGVYLDGTGDADLFVGKPGSEVVGRYVLESRGGSGQVQSGVAPVVGETVLLVVRADFRPGPDSFVLYVNPDPCGPEPASGTLKDDLDLGDVTAVVLYSTGAFSVDELRMSSRFEDLLLSGGAECDPSQVGAQIPSDCNQDGTLDLSDGVCLLNFLFLGTIDHLPCGSGEVSDPANVALLDSNGDDEVDLSDATRVFSFLFLGGPPPVLGTGCTAISGCPDARGCGR